MEGPVRKAVIAGSWYPGDPESLRRDIRRYLDSACVEPPEGKPVALVSPHAGYLYSGPVAAFAYKAVEGLSYSTVVVISPSHRVAFPSVSVWPSGAYETPLGRIEVDEALCSELLEWPVFTDDTRPHAREHALEIQLPFLQVTLGSFKLCPLIMGSQDADVCESVARALHEAVLSPEDTLVVASSDLSHFHRSTTAERMDLAVAKYLESFDITSLSKALDRSEVEACGGGPILTAMIYAKLLGRTTSRVLRYAHSGHVTGDNSSVVGYLAALIR